MNDGTFELDKLGWYKVQNVQENEFLNEKLENDMYGIWYSVKFEGDADTHLWQAKSAPKEGEKVYGHLEKTKSGKSTRFKRAKKEDTPHDANQAASGNAPTGVSTSHKDDDRYWDDKNAQIRAQWAIGQAVQVTGQWLPNDIENKAIALFNMVDRVKGSSDNRPNLDSPEIPLNKVSGYDKFKASRPNSDEDAEAQSLYQSIASQEQPEDM